MKPTAELYALLAPGWMRDSSMLRTSFVQGRAEALQRAAQFAGVQAIENMSTREITRVRDDAGTWCGPAGEGAQ